MRKCVKIFLAIFVVGFCNVLWIPKLMQQYNFVKERKSLFKRLSNKKLDQMKYGKSLLSNKAAKSSEAEPLKPKPNKEGPLILLWTTSQGHMSELGSKYDDRMYKDGVGNCRVTTDRTKFNESKAVVIYQNYHLIRRLDVPDPKYRKPHQVYVFHSKETPSKTFYARKFLQHSDIDGIFNMTMWFRRDSDIRKHFGTLETALYRSRINNLSNLESVMKTRTFLAVWGVSNCDSTYGAKKRLEYGKELISNGLDVTTIGKCFGKFTKHSVKTESEFMNYKFYLAFENSIHCPDYLTEKFWRNGLGTGAVPVVFGPTKADVEALAPKNSFIHTDDFKSAKDLVEYLNYLDKNDSAYLQYHQWRKTPLDVEKAKLLMNPEWNTFYQLCEKISVKNMEHKTIPSVTDWMYKSDLYVDDECLPHVEKYSQ